MSLVNMAKSMPREVPKQRPGVSVSQQFQNFSFNKMADQVRYPSTQFPAYNSNYNCGKPKTDHLVPFDMPKSFPKSTKNKKSLNFNS